MLMRRFFSAIALGAFIASAVSAADNPLPRPTEQWLRDGDGDPLPRGAVARLGTKRFRPQKPAQGISFLPDGRTVVQTSQDGYLRYWDAATGRLRREVKVWNHSISAAAHTPDGKSIAARGFYHDEINNENVYWLAVFDAQTGEKQMSLESDIPWDAALAISPAGNLVVSGGQTVRVFDVAAGTQAAERTLELAKAEAVAFSPDGTVVAAGDNRGHLLLWNWSIGAEPRKVNVGVDSRRNARVISVAFSPDGRYVAAGIDSTQGVQLVEVASGLIVREFRVDGIVRMYPGCLRFSPDGKLLTFTVNYNDGGGVPMFEVESGKMVRRLEFPCSSFNSIAFSADGKQIAGAGKWDHVFAVWNVETGERKAKELEGHFLSPSELRFFDDDTKLASTGEDGTIRIWNLLDSKQIRMFRHEPNGRGFVRMIRGLDVSPDDNRLATSGLDNTVRLWDVDTGREIYRLPGHGSVGGRRDIRFTPDGKRFVSWGDDQRIYVWDVATGKALREFLPQLTGVTLPERVDGSLAALEAIGFQGGMLSPDASLLFLSLASSHVVRIETGKETGKFAGLGNQITGLAISADKQYLLASHWGEAQRVKMANGKIRHTTSKLCPLQLRKLETGELVSEILLDGFTRGVSLAPNGRMAAVATDDDDPTILLLHVPELTEIAAIKPPAWVKSVEFSHSGELLAASLGDATVTVWEVDRLQRTTGATNPEAEP
jgi:WD40 repeat protein